MSVDGRVRGGEGQTVLTCDECDGSDLQCLRHGLFDVVEVGITATTGQGQLMLQVLVNV